jgi:hypothetical protein
MLIFHRICPEAVIAKSYVPSSQSLMTTCCLRLFSKSSEVIPLLLLRINRTVDPSSVGIALRPLEENLLLDEITENLQTGWANSNWRELRLLASSLLGYAFTS